MPDGHVNLTEASSLPFPAGKPVVGNTITLSGLGGCTVQELGGGCKGLHRQTDRFNQRAKSVADRNIVVDQKDGLVRVPSAVARTSRCRYCDAIGLLRHRQLEFKCCAGLRVIGACQLAAVRRNEVPADRKSHAHALRLWGKE